MEAQHFDWIVIGSGFGGSVAALRLVEKGYSVLVLEKGRRFTPESFPRTNWELHKWMWSPKLGMRGFFQMSMFEHVTALHGVGVGGGSLTYANTLPVPNQKYFQAPSWADLADWRAELTPHYETAQRMLGAAANPRLGYADLVVREIARDIGRSEHFFATDVGVFFGEANRKVPDPYFDGEGPDRIGCTFCGACLTGCRVGAKNTLDKNYLYLAERRGCELWPETEVTAVRPRRQGGYEVAARPSLGRSRQETILTADKVVFAGGVLGTVPLLLALRAEPDGLPNLSPRVGELVRTNNEALVGVVAPDTKENFTEGVALGSILHADEHSHFEPVHYGEGSSFFRLLSLPHSPAPTRLGRLAGVFKAFAGQPLRWAKAFAHPFASTKGLTLVYMQTLDSTLKLRLSGNGRRPRLVTELMIRRSGRAHSSARRISLIRRFTDKVDGVPMTLMTEFLAAVPTTAHILGGCCFGADADAGVIDTQHRLHGYDGLYVIDGSAISANPGVNPALSITALAERAMSFIPERG